MPIRRRNMMKALLILAVAGVALAYTSPAEACGPGHEHNCDEVFCEWVGGSPEEQCSEAWIQLVCPSNCLDAECGQCGWDPECDGMEDHAAFFCSTGSICVE